MASRLLLALLLCVVPASRAIAQVTPMRCDLQSCTDLAYANHPILKSGEAKQVEAKALLQLRKAERLPSVTVEGTVGFLDGESVSGSSALKGIDQQPVSGAYWLATPSVEIPIFAEGSLIGQPSVGVRQAEFGVSEKEWGLRSLRLQVATKVAEAYVDVLKNQIATETNAKIVGLTETRYKLALAQFNQNLISKTDLLTVEVQLATAKRDLEVANVTLRRTRQTLVLTMSLEAVEPIDVEEIPEVPGALQPVTTLTASAYQAHPDIKVQEFKVLQSREEVKRVESGLYPTLSVNGSFSYADDFSPSGSSRWDAFLRVKVPIFDFGRIKAQAAMARARATDDEKVLEDIRLRIAQDIVTQYYLVRELEVKRELTGKQIEQAGEAARLNRALFEQGLLSIATLHETEAALLGLRLAQVSLENDQKLARLRLKLLSGG